MDLDSIVESLSGKKRVRIRMGVRPSGFPHIGTAHVINSCFLLYKRLAEEGKIPTLDITITDLQPTANNDSYGPILRYDRFNDSKGTSKSAYYSKFLIQYISAIASSLRTETGDDVNFKIHYDSKIQKDPRYRKIMKSMLDILDLDEGVSLPYTPTSLICRQCKQPKPSEYQEGFVFAKCQTHGPIQAEVFDLSKEFSTHFVLSSVLRTLYFNSDVHVIGRNHDLKGTLTQIQDITAHARKTLPQYLVTAYFPGVSKSANSGGLPKCFSEFGVPESAPYLLRMSETLHERGWKEVRETTALNLFKKYMAAGPKVL